MLGKLTVTESEKSHGRSESDRVSAAVKHHFGLDYVTSDLSALKPRPGQLQALQWITEHPFQSFYLTGINRSGKSFLMAAEYRALLEKIGVGFGMAEVFSDAGLEKCLIEAQIYRERDYLKNDYGNKRFFFFKDFGKLSRNKELILTPLFDFFDYLSSESKRMFFCSNYTLEQLASFGDAWVGIAARINEKCKVLTVE